jgi:adenosylmethionine-8-amino-7-oxononanoate aminotransferase
MTHVFHRHTKVAYPTAIQGDGCYIIDQKGKRYLDGSSGAAVSCLGHSNKEVVEAIAAQAGTLAFAHTGFFTNEPMEKLADYLVSKAPAGISNVYFVSGGSEAVEGALKLARQYFLEIGKPQKSKIITRWHSYHGNTLGALSAGGNKWRRAQFEPLLIDMPHISPCFEYRGKNAGESSEAYGLRVANELEQAILEAGAENVAAFIAEPVVGATIGCVPAVKGYFKRIREICDQYNVLLILDEVMCGMGRTGTLFACEQEGVTADIITIAKGLAAGYQPIGAMLVSKKIFDAVQQGSGFFQHGHTYMGHATACAAALAVQHIIQRDKLLENVQKQGAYLEGALRSQFSHHPHVGDIRGRGLFWGLELVQDKATKAPFSSTQSLNSRIKAHTMESGLMCYPMGGTVDGKLGDHVMLAPPFIVNETHIDEIITKLSKAIDKAIAETQVLAA